MLKIFSSFLIILLGSFSVLAQTGTVRGYVYEKETGAPVMFGNVYLEGTTYGVTSDVNGFYTIADVPVGSYKLVASYVGFDTASVMIVIKKGAIELKNLYLNESSVTLGEINISAAREQARTTVNISQISVSQKQIKALPSTGGEADIAQYLQVIPGVVTTGDQGGQIFIRGGAPVQNKILLDGLNIYNPFHSIGFYSIFETELIRSVDVLTGGFGAEQGGRVSAIVDIKTREGNKSRTSGFVSGGPFLAKAMIEGPIKKFKENGTSVSYVLTGKKSLIEQTSRNLYSFLAPEGQDGLPFSFQDVYGKLSVNTASGSRINLFGFNFTDKYNNPQIANIGWKNNGGGANFSLVPYGSDIVVNGLLGFSTYTTSFNEETGKPRRSDIDELTANIDFTFFGAKNEIKYGLELKSVRTDFEFFNPFGIRLGQEQNATELGAFVRYRQILGNLIIDPSFRVQYYSTIGGVSLEPRMGLKYNISDNLRFKAAGGRYSQNILSTSNDRDVVNLFTGFLTTPEGPVQSLSGGNLENKLQISNHAVAGIEYDLGNNWQFNIETYYKNFPKIIVVNRNKVDSEQPDYSTEDGEAYGIDFSVKYEQKRIYLWATYSHGYVTRFDGEQTYPTVFDRRHNVNFLTSYDLDEKGTWQASVRWNLGSGFPFTKTRGFYNFLDFFQGVDTPYETENPDNVGVIFSQTRNGGRLPYYHRLDISVQKKIAFSKHSGLEIVGSITNAYDRPNIFYFDRISYKRVDQLPVIPSLSAKFYF